MYTLYMKDEIMQKLCISGHVCSNAQLIFSRYIHESSLFNVVEM